MRMQDKITKRFKELVEGGEKLVNQIGSDNDGDHEYYVHPQEIPAYQKWLSSVLNLLHAACPRDSEYINDAERIMKHEAMQNGIPSVVVTKMMGLLESAQHEWAEGLLRKIEYIIAAETFDDFLDHAASYHKANKKTEASVLASAVLEDTVKKIAMKNSINSTGRSLDPLIDELVKASVFDGIKAKRAKAYAAVRNKALHAEWDEFTIKDVGEMINGIRELIEDFL